MPAKICEWKDEVLLNKNDPLGGSLRLSRQLNPPTPPKVKARLKKPKPLPNC